MFWFHVLALLFRGHFLLFIGLRYHAKVYSMSTSESGGPVHAVLLPPATCIKFRKFIGS